MKNFGIKISRKSDTIILSVIIAIFLAFYCILSFNNRPVSEDYEFIRIFQQRGWIGSILYSLNEVSFRLPSKILFNLFFGYVGFEDIKYAIFIYHLASVSFLVFAIHKLLSSLADLFLSQKPPQKVILGFSILWIGAFFFGTFQIADTWFWLISSVIHLQSCTFCILGVAYLLKKEKTLPVYLLIILSFAFAGGSSENLALFILTTLFLASIYLWKNKQNRFDLYHAFFKKTLTALIIVFLSFTINISGSGTAKRIVNQEKVNMLYKPLAVKSTSGVNEFSYNNLHKTLFNYRSTVSCMFSVSWFFLGLWLHKKGIKINNFRRKRAIVFAIGIIFIVLLTTLLPLYFIFGGPGPLRAWMPISMVFSLLSCFLFLAIGYSYSNQKITILARLIAYTLIPITTFYLIRQYKFTTKHSNAYDIRYQYLMQLKQSGNKKTIDLEGLPNPGFLPSGDITDDENYTLNTNYQIVLGLDFKVKSTNNYYNVNSNLTKR